MRVSRLSRHYAVLSMPSIFQPIKLFALTAHYDHWRMISLLTGIWLATSKEKKLCGIICGRYSMMGLKNKVDRANGRFHTPPVPHVGGGLLWQPCFISGKAKADNRKVYDHRLCVLGYAPFASGSRITTIFDCRTFTSVSCPHFGQNSGKLVSVVSPRIRVRVLPLQTGHSSHSPLFTASPAFFLSI